MEINEARRLKELERENRELKQMLADPENNFSDLCGGFEALVGDSNKFVPHLFCQETINTLFYVSRQISRIR
jgi:hypothetical protein